MALLPRTVMAPHKIKTPDVVFGALTNKFEFLEPLRYPNLQATMFPSKSNWNSTNEAQRSYTLSPNRYGALAADRNGGNLSQNVGRLSSRKRKLRAQSRLQTIHPHPLTLLVVCETCVQMKKASGLQNSGATMTWPHPGRASTGKAERGNELPEQFSPSLADFLRTSGRTSKFKAL